MSTVYDWITVLIFIGLLGLFFLRRSADDVSLARYLLASAGCAVANYLGNAGFDIAAVILIMGTLYFAWRFILLPGRPEGSGRR